jgi:uncharacterized protein (DUF488 family)
VEPNEGRTPEADARLVYTIGHADRSFGAVERHLDRHGIGMLVDVRSRPYSGYAPDFTKAELEACCAAAGIAYRWMGDRLGGRPEGTSGAPDWDRLAGTDAFAAALDEVIELASGGTIALLCAEGMPDHCHRSTAIAPRLEGRGLTVMHVLPDGSLARHQPTLFPPGA